MMYFFLICGGYLFSGGSNDFIISPAVGGIKKKSTRGEVGRQPARRPSKLLLCLIIIAGAVIKK